MTALDAVRVRHYFDTLPRTDDQYEAPPLPRYHYTSMSTDTVCHLPGADGLGEGHHRGKQGALMCVNSTVFSF